MKEVTIEKGTTYAELTDEQGVVIDGVLQMIDALQEMIDTFEETIDYNEPTLNGHAPSLPEGYLYTTTTDLSKFIKLKKRISDLHEAYDKVVKY